MGLLGSRPYYGECRSTDQATGTAKYGCDEWKECDTRKSSPPYNPKQPEKCKKHKALMKTRIPEGER